MMPETMMILVTKGLHVLAAVIWIGGMFFAYQVLRPSIGGIEPPPERLRLWGRVFERFFKWVWIAVVVLLATGYWMVVIELGGFAVVGIDVHIMQGLGLIMIVIFLHLYFASYGRFRRALASEDFASAGQALNQIRTMVATNLVLGLVIALVGGTGRHWG